MLDCGGISWHGWRLAPYGNAKEWRLQAPGDGPVFTANEILDCRAHKLNAEYYQYEMQKARHLATTPKQLLTPEQRSILIAALQVLLMLDGDGTAPAATSHGPAAGSNKDYYTLDNALEMLRALAPTGSRSGSI